MIFPHSYERAHFTLDHLLEVAANAGICFMLTGTIYNSRTSIVDQHRSQDSRSNNRTNHFDLTHKLRMDREDDEAIILDGIRERTERKGGREWRKGADLPEPLEALLDFVRGFVQVVLSFKRRCASASPSPAPSSPRTRPRAVQCLPSLRKSSACVIPSALSVVKRGKQDISYCGTCGWVTWHLYADVQHSSSYE